MFRGQGEGSRAPAAGYHETLEKRHPIKCKDGRKVLQHAWDDLDYAGHDGSTWVRWQAGKVRIRV